MSDEIFCGGYEFVDVDENGVPEIVVFDATQCATLYWIENNKVRHEEGLGASVWWNPQTKEFISMSSNQGWQSMHIDKFDFDTKFETLKRASWNEDEKGDHYSIDDKKCTKKEFDALINSSTENCTELLGANDIKEIVEAIKKYDQTNSTVTAANASTQWKDAYVEYLSSHKNEIGGCELAYLNNDDISELFTHTEKSPSHAAGVPILTVMNGKVKQIGDHEYGSSGCVGVFERSGILLSEYCGMGEIDSTYYKINQSNELEKIAHLLVTDADLPEKSKYYINDDEVAKKQWENKCAEIEPDNIEKKWVVSEPLTVDKMKKKISNMK